MNLGALYRARTPQRDRTRCDDTVTHACTQECKNGRSSAAFGHARHAVKVGAYAMLTVSALHTHPVSGCNASVTSLLPVYKELLLIAALMAALSPPSASTPTPDGIVLPSR